MDALNPRQKTDRLALIFLIIIASDFTFSVIVNFLKYKFNISVPSWMSSMFIELLFIVPLLIYCHKSDKSIREVIKFKKIKPTSVLLVILIAFVSLPIYTFANLFSQLFVSNATIQAVKDMNTPISFAITCFLLVIVAPLFEESVFRGYFFYHLSSVKTILKTVLITALFFGIAHMNFNQFCYAFVFGFIIAIVNQASGSIISSMTVHAIVNTVLGIIPLAVANAFSDVNAIEQAETIRKSGIMIIITCIVFLVAIACTALLILLLIALASNENRLDSFKAVFSRKNKNGEIEATNQSTSSFSICLTIAILIGLILMLFGRNIILFIFN